MKTLPTRKQSYSLALLSLVLLFSAIPAFSQSGVFDINTSPLPAPTSPIMDYANVIDETTERRIEQKLIDFRDRSNPKVEIGVAVVDTTGGIPIFDYSLAVSRGWKIGTTATDNPAALLFVAVNDRKYFTQVSYDLEDELPDGVVGSIQRNFLVPEFKKGNYGKGIEDTIDAFIRKIEEKQDPDAAVQEDADEAESDSGGITSGDFYCCGIVVIAFLFFIVMVAVRVNRSGGGKGGGMGWGDAAGDVAIDVIGGIILGVLSGGGSSSSSSSDSWGGSSGGSSGGDWGGFSGGGDFGGGGSGGSW